MAMATLAYLFSIVTIFGPVSSDKILDLKLCLSISAQQRQLEVSWVNAKPHPDDMVLITNQEPVSFEKVKLQLSTEMFNDGTEGSGSGAGSGVAIVNETSFLNVIPLDKFESPQHYWIANSGTADIVASVRPRERQQWYTTPIRFDYGLSRNVTIHTTCYGYWASYVNGSGDILSSNCIRAYPKWMNEMRYLLHSARIRDLFIPGTHDSGSYRPNFSPSSRETILTKYALTQDDDIRGQLMHGVRYLDIRVGYYTNTEERFFINHGIMRQRPLSEVIDQVIDFVQETNEIVIFAVKEFPVGFGKTLGVHRLLVSYLKRRFGELLAIPNSASWYLSLRDIWSVKQNVILSYDNYRIVSEFERVLYHPVEQRWADVRTWPRLEKYLYAVHSYDRELSSRPVVDMAELTPDTWGVITDKYGGLRKMADEVNWRISDLYRDNLGDSANIVAADFIRGTCLADIAMEYNKKKLYSTAIKN